MKFIRTLVCPVLLTASLLLAVRGLLVTHVQLPPDTAVYGLQPNQHVLVSLTYYGLKVPGEAIWGYHRWGYRVPEWGDAILFNLPRPKAQHGPGPETVGICHALPGETVWIDPVRPKVLPARTTHRYSATRTTHQNYTTQRAPHGLLAAHLRKSTR